MSETSSGSHAHGGRAEAPLKFNFDARNKSMVPSVLEEETRRLKRMFARKPKVSLNQLDESLRNGTPDAEQVRKMLGAFRSFYNNHERAQQFFESASRILLEAAAKETGSAGRQRALLRMAYDMAETALFKTPKKVNVTAQSIIVAICRILGTETKEQYFVEREVHKEMASMLNVKKDPNDFTSRERLIKLYMHGHRYYEALVQIAEYEKIMQTKSRPLYHQKKGDIAFRKAQVFQTVIDHYQKVGSGGRSDQDKADRARELERLEQFVQRFNRDNRYNITPLKGQGVLALQKTLVSMVTIANTFYTEAAKVQAFQHKHKPLFFMARNNYMFDNTKRTLQNLIEGIRLLDQSRLPARQKSAEKLKFLEFQHRVYVEQNQHRKADEVAQLMTKLRKEAQQQPAQAAEA